jgi:hypothetical protein
MKLWIARNTDDTLVLFQSKPILGSDFIWEELLNEDCMYIEEYLFPEVTWENSPKEIELKLVEEE